MRRLSLKNYILIVILLLLPLLRHSNLASVFPSLHQIYLNPYKNGSIDFFVSIPPLYLLPLPLHPLIATILPHYQTRLNQTKILIILLFFILLVLTSPPHRLYHFIFVLLPINVGHTWNHHLRHHHHLHLHHRPPKYYLVFNSTTHIDYYNYHYRFRFDNSWINLHSTYIE